MYTAIKIENFSPRETPIRSGTTLCAPRGFTPPLQGGEEEGNTVDIRSFMIFGCGSLGYSPITFVHLKEKLKFTSILLVKNRKGYELKVHNLQLEYPIVDPKY